MTFYVQYVYALHLYTNIHSMYLSRTMYWRTYVICVTLYGQISLESSIANLNGFHIL